MGITEHDETDNDSRQILFQFKAEDGGLIFSSNWRISSSNLFRWIQRNSVHVWIKCVWKLFLIEISNHTNFFYTARWNIIYQLKTEIQLKISEVNRCVFFKYQSVEDETFVDFIHLIFYEKSFINLLIDGDRAYSTNISFLCIYCMLTEN